MVTDVFGTDLSLTEGFKGSFVVVPHNLVAGRWMRGETGWIPAVVGHIVRAPHPPHDLNRCHAERLALSAISRQGSRGGRDR